MNAPPAPITGALSEKDKLYRIASCSYPIRSIFKSRGAGNPVTQKPDAHCRDAIQRLQCLLSVQVARTHLARED